MKFSLLSAAALALVSLSAQATLLTITPSGSALEGVQLGSQATVTNDLGTSQIAFVNAGVRVKKVAVINVKVYVTQFFADQPARFVKTPATADLAVDTSSLKSIADLGTVALKLDFVRDLDAASIVDSFDDALKANGLTSATDTGLSEVLRAIEAGGDMYPRDSISIVGVNGATNDTLYIENNRGVARKITADNKLVEKMFSIWFGIPADSGLKTLKGALTK